MSRMTLCFGRDRQRYGSQSQPICWTIVGDSAGGGASGNAAEPSEPMNPPINRNVSAAAVPRLVMAPCRSGLENEAMRAEWRTESVFAAAHAAWSERSSAHHIANAREAKRGSEAEGIDLDQFYSFRARRRAGEVGVHFTEPARMGLPRSRVAACGCSLRHTAPLALAASDRNALGAMWARSCIELFSDFD